MEKRNTLTKILAIAGTALIWAPLLFMAVTSLIGSISEGRLMCDYLMPAEMFPVELLGGALLLWAALRAKSRLKAVAWGCGVMAFFLACAMIIPQATGLANGSTKPEGWPWLLTLGALAVYTLAVIWLGVTGLMLSKGLCGKH